jgi:hypothetical protein
LIVTYDRHNAETEAPAAFDNRGYTCDVDDPLIKLVSLCSTIPCSRHLASDDP